MCRYFEKRKLTRYLNHLNTASFPSGYLEHHRNRKNAIEWLIAYYEGRTGCTPKQYLKAIIDSYAHTEVDNTFRLETIHFLYYWVNYKSIVGF